MKLFATLNKTALFLLIFMTKMNAQNIKLETSNETIKIHCSCDNGVDTTKVLYTDDKRDLSIILVDKTIYYTWRSKTSLSETYYFHRFNVDETCRFEYYLAHYIGRKYIDKKLAKKDYICLTEKGICVKFAWGKRSLITFDEIKEKSLQDIVKSRWGKSGAPPQE